MKGITTFLIALILAGGPLLHAQEYYVHFTDKGENLAMLDDPYSFLSPKAVENRAVRDIGILPNDLPVSGEYLMAVGSLGFDVKMKSRWFNFAVVHGEGSLSELKEFSFVEKVEVVEPYKAVFTDLEAFLQGEDLEYGPAQNQIEMLEGDYLHEKGYLGQGMTIAVLDGGFSGTPSLPGFDSLWVNRQILGSYDFVQNDTDVYDVGSHGTKVLSIMGGYLPGSYTGTAIKADYWLLKSENETSESVAEMYNWLAAAEFADSVGADVITSSLGYNKFDGGIGDYDYADMDGNTTVVTNAADMAAAKGILVIVSAGNEGRSSWGKITAPADADSALAVGAVDASGEQASFSSTGPTFDNRIKPDVMAQGRSAAYLNFGGPVKGHGTSFACPVITGLAACLWQSNISATNMEVFQAIRSTASQSSTPDNTYGYGIANFRKAAALIEKEAVREETEVSVYPNPVGSEYWLEIAGISKTLDVKVSTYDLSGRLLLRQELLVQNNVPVLLDAPKGIGAYLVSINTGEEVFVKKIFK